MASTEEQVRPRKATNDIIICDKCRHIRIKSLASKLQAAAPGTEIKVGCKSYCGPCKRTGFVFVNGRYLKGDTEEELVEKAKPFIK
ncbi:DUF1450 domain-containing protein [Cohnella thailandensis]|jgi:Uncharacterized protein conserved in bacteria|uniref:DUF1450 domain-containing protein n=1 Tax=Cohnella thailandensis TaxID=557557 RepID=A0A841T1G0_9BACL|nr:DUF1450 domain-containing protein [Cohnella thailandensis]MBB6638243.1 DUF1450 domain-containing protein [Cohnella thailandensis]MBP1977804.1 uncharacterized protein YuzB (UPF0349 family) [Cohnella thailandensis]